MYYVFEKKTESCVKDGTEKSHERTTRVNKTDKVSTIVEQLVNSGANYLRHWEHVDNIPAVLPNIKERHTGRYIKMNFSENIALKTKQEVQEAHFSGKHYTLYCSIFQPGDNKFVHHVSDDTIHDLSFVRQVLKDIFDRWNIRNEITIIKSDKAPAQYKKSRFYNHILPQQTNTKFVL